MRTERRVQQLFAEYQIEQRNRAPWPLDASDAGCGTVCYCILW
jgi:hypothetical protein